MVTVTGLGPIGRHFNNVMLVFGGSSRMKPCYFDAHRAELVFVDMVWEKLLDLLRSGIGRDIPVFGLPTEQDIAHAAANDIRLETSLLETGKCFLHWERNSVLHGEKRKRNIIKTRNPEQNTGNQSLKHKRVCAF